MAFRSSHILKFSSSTSSSSNFVDRCILVAYGGNGGNGLQTYKKHAKHSLLGPGLPWGGPGGHGGDVIIKAIGQTCQQQQNHDINDIKLNSDHLDADSINYRGSSSTSQNNSQISQNFQTLSNLKDHYQGVHGGEGKRQFKAGVNGRVTCLRCPTGVRISEYKGYSNIGNNTQNITLEPVADLLHHLDTYVLAHGGLGGRGNTYQDPHNFEKGQKGEGPRKYLLELRSIADCGLVGLPNAGKSSFLRAVSRAKPKVASYPFTTLAPWIGSVRFPELQFEQAQQKESFQYTSSLSIADVPGLVENAHLDEGLGHEFLRHLERTKFLAYVVDMNPLKGWGRGGQLMKGGGSQYFNASQSDTQSNRYNNQQYDSDNDYDFDQDIENLTTNSTNTRCVIKNFLTLQDEVARYSLEMALRPFIILANKCDTGPVALENCEKLTNYIKNEWNLSHVLSKSMLSPSDSESDADSDMNNNTDSDLNQFSKLFTTLHGSQSPSLQRKLNAMQSFQPEIFAISASEGLGCTRALKGMKKLLDKINHESESGPLVESESEFGNINYDSRGFYPAGTYGGTGNSKTEFM